MDGKYIKIELFSDYQFYTIIQLYFNMTLFFFNLNFYK